MPKKKQSAKKNGNGATLGFEQKLWGMADGLRGHMDAAEYKHVALGLIFLKYISDSFQECRDILASRDDTDEADLEDRDEYLARGRVLGAEGCTVEPYSGECYAADDWQNN